jgi:hypothetical protein
MTLSFILPYNHLSLAQCHANSWFCQNGLCLNPNKCKATLFSTHHCRHHFPTISNINIAGTTVDLSSKITTLDVTLDSTFSFKPHMSQMSARPLTFITLLLGISALCKPTTWQHLSPLLWLNLAWTMPTPYFTRPLQTILTNCGELKTWPSTCSS